MKQDNIILIGMPGAGKSTVGILLAKMLGYEFLDTDITIQSCSGKKLYEIINDRGLDFFIQYENDILMQVDVEHTVIATGGSAVYGALAMEYLKSIGTVVYIRLSCEEIIRRVNNVSTRGIAMKQGMTMQDVYAERTPLYEKYADIVVNPENMTIEQCAAMIIENIK